MSLYISEGRLDHNVGLAAKLLNLRGKIEWKGAVNGQFERGLHQCKVLFGGRFVTQES